MQILPKNSVYRSLGQHPLILLDRPEHQKHDAYVFLVDNISRALENHPVINGDALPKWLSDENSTGQQVEYLILQMVIFFNLLYLSEKTGRKAESDKLFMDLAHLTSVPESHNLSVLRGFFQFVHEYVRSLRIPFGPLLRSVPVDPITDFVSSELTHRLLNGAPSSRLASRFALESWLVSGFWDELASSLMAYKNQLDLNLMPISYFSSPTGSFTPPCIPLVAEIYFQCGIHEDRFLADVVSTLDCIDDFWSSIGRKTLYAQK